MSFQIRAVPAEQSALGKEIARLLENAAQDILGGVTLEQYLPAVARYQVLLQLMDFMTERRALEEGDHVDE